MIFAKVTLSKIIFGGIQLFAIVVQQKLTAAGQNFTYKLILSMSGVEKILGAI